MAKKNNTNKRPKLKPVADALTILDMVNRYNRFNVGNTPEQIYNERNLIHNLMSQYSNADKIYQAIVEDRDTSPNGESYVIIPKEAGVFPGYLPQYGGYLGFGKNSISGYEPKDKDKIVPAGAIAVNDVVLFNDLTEGDQLYAPDFKGSYMYYYYPQVLEPQVSLYVLEDELEDKPEDESDFTSDADNKPIDINNNIVSDNLVLNDSFDIYDLFSPDDEGDAWWDLLSKLYDYYSNNGTFNYLDTKVGELMDKYRLSPILLYNAIDEYMNYLNTNYGDSLNEELSTEEKPNDSLNPLKFYPFSNIINSVYDIIKSQGEENLNVPLVQPIILQSKSSLPSNITNEVPGKLVPKINILISNIPDITPINNSEELLPPINNNIEELGRPGGVPSDEPFETGYPYGTRYNRGDRHKVVVPVNNKIIVKGNPQFILKEFERVMTPISEVDRAIALKDLDDYRLLLEYKRNGDWENYYGLLNYIRMRLKWLSWTSSFNLIYGPEELLQMYPPGDPLNYLPSKYLKDSKENK